jgi:misacylated tRNA(Ala) deacylase
MTELLYLRDGDAAYVQRFTAKVTALPPGAVVLDRTFFYAVGGGQPADRGVLATPGGDEVPIADVARSGGVVLHRIGRGGDRAARSLKVGDEVEGRIDWERRFEHMRLHTGQHLASALLFRATGLRTKEAVLGKGQATLELEAPFPSETKFGEWVGTFELSVAGDRPLRVRYQPRAEYERAPPGRSGLIPLPPGVDPVRLIEIDGVDVNPCGGTHLRSTGAIGAVRFTPPPPEAPARIAFTLGPASAATPSA